MKIHIVITILASLFLLIRCNDVPATQDFSDATMSDGTVLEVTPEGHVQIGARASLIVAADGTVHIQGPFSVEDALIVRDGQVFIKDLQREEKAAKRIQELEERIASLERKIVALEKNQRQINLTAR